MKPSRCHDCRHRRRRAVTLTSKQDAARRVHKKPCDCACHKPPPRPVRTDRSRPGWWEDCEYVQ